MSLAHGVVMPGFSGTTVPPWVAHALREGLVGVILFAENVPDVRTARRLTDEVRAIRPDAVVSCDEEGGDVTRIEARTGSSIPGNAALGVIDDVHRTRRIAEAYGAVISAAGIDVTLAPVLDVLSEPRNPVIGVRSFGQDPAIVIRHGRAFHEGLAAAGVATVAKHFPGHGSTRVDSHLGLPVLDVGVELLRARDEAPFREVPTDGILTAHVVVPEFGQDPATLSAWAPDEIRATGFAGPVVTDALGMRAITDRIEIGEACVRALDAGADLLLLDAPHQSSVEADFHRAVEAIEEALRAGRLEPDQLQRSARRNATLLRRRAPFDETLAQRLLQELADLGVAAAADAVTVVGDVRLTGHPVVVDVRRRINHASGSITNRLVGAFAEAGFPVTVGQVGAELPDGAQMVVLTRQPLHDDEEAAALARALATHPGAIVVHGGVAAAAPDVPRLVCMHGVGAVNASAAVEAMRRA